jgi:hypothetical protein
MIKKLLSIFKRLKKVKPLPPSTNMSQADYDHSMKILKTNLANLFSSYCLMHGVNSFEDNAYDRYIDFFHLYKYDIKKIHMDNYRRVGSLYIHREPFDVGSYH